MLGGSNGALLRRWDRSRNDNSSYNKHIDDTSSRWLEIECAYKSNNNMTATKGGKPNHKPTQKHDCICDVLVHNANVLSKGACLDQCADETSWMFAGWAEKDSGIVKTGLEKPGGSKGGQTVVTTDADRVRIRACQHHHKGNPRAFGLEGCNKVKLIVDQLTDMIREPNQQGYEIVNCNEDCH